MKTPFDTCYRHEPIERRHADRRAVPPLGAEIDRLRAVNAELVAALQQIADGETMAGRSAFTHLEVVVRYQEIARAALTKAQP